MEIEKLTGWQPIETLAMWDVAIVTDGENVAKAQKAEADYGGHYFAVDPEDCLEWEPTLWIACPGDEATTRAPADLRSALEAETIERCALECLSLISIIGAHPGSSIDSALCAAAEAIRALAPTKGDVS